MKSGVYATQLRSAVFKQVLVQQVHDTGFDPDFRDDRKLRLNWNQSFFRDTMYRPMGA